jgi:dihydrofolate reductase
MQIALIAAIDEQMTIGDQGETPWNLPADLRRFKQLTLGKPVLMGRKTYESIGKPLPGRTNIVITRQDDYEAAGCRVAHSPEAALDIAETVAGPEIAMVIGGADIYDALMPKADRLYLTVLYDAFGGDTFFPSFSSAEWIIEQRDEVDQGDDAPCNHAYFSLRRNRDKPMTSSPNDAPAPLPDFLRHLDDLTEEIRQEIEQD